MLYPETDLESYITEYTSIYEEYQNAAASISQPQVYVPRMKHILSKPPLLFSCCRDGTHSGLTPFCSASSPYWS